MSGLPKPGAEAAEAHGREVITRQRKQTVASFEILDRVHLVVDPEGDQACAHEDLHAGEEHVGDRADGDEANESRVLLRDLLHGSKLKTIALVL